MEESDHASQNPSLSAHSHYSNPSHSHYSNPSQNSSEIDLDEMDNMNDIDDEDDDIDDEEDEDDEDDIEDMEEDIDGEIMDIIEEGYGSEEEAIQQEIKDR